MTYIYCSVLNQDVGAVMVDGANAEVRTYLVLDTNVLIHDLSFVTDLIHRGKSGRSYAPRLRGSVGSSDHA